MENKLEVSSKLDLAVNKDDLMEMLIDQQLTTLEKEVELLEKQIKDLKEDRRIKLEEKLRKLFPKEVTVSKSYELKYSTSYNNSSCICVSYDFGKFKIVIDNLSVEFENKDKIRELENKISDNNNNIVKIEKSGKRIKAKMLKEFLNNSTEGKSILALMNKSEIKLIG